MMAHAASRRSKNKTAASRRTSETWETSPERDLAYRARCREPKERSLPSRKNGERKLGYSMRKVDLAGAGQQTVIYHYDALVEPQGAEKKLRK